MAYEEEFLARFVSQRVMMPDKNVIVELLNFPLSLCLISYFSLRVPLRTLKEK